MYSLQYVLQNGESSLPDIDTCYASKQIGIAAADKAIALYKKYNTPITGDKHTQSIWELYGYDAKEFLNAYKATFSDVVTELEIVVSDIKECKYMNNTLIGVDFYLIIDEGYILNIGGIEKVSEAIDIVLYKYSASFPGEPPLRSIQIVDQTTCEDETLSIGLCGKDENDAVQQMAFIYNMIWNSSPIGRFRG